MRKKAEVDDDILAVIPNEMSSKESRQNWARLIQKIYEVDPLICPKCWGQMHIISFIEELDIIEKILRHLGLWDIGFRVGFLRDANLSKFIKENINSFKMDYIRRPDWVAQNIKRVLLNRLVAAYDLNDVTLKYEACKMRVLDQIKILPLPEKPIYAYTVFSKKTAHARKYLDQYNQIFDQPPFSYNDFIRKELEKLAKTRLLESRAEKQLRE